MSREIAVWMFASHVGTLTLSAGRLRFQYGADWLERPDATALSQSLPIQAEPFDDQSCRAFFAGLLPEGHLRRLIARRYQVSSQNDFALLNAIGGECAGAITFLPTAQTPPVIDQQTVQWLDSRALLDVLDELPRRPMMAGRDGIRLSLAGAQDKLPVVFDGQRIGLPQGGQPSTHIMKPAISSVDDSVFNEGFCMTLAQSAGLPAAQARIFGVDDRDVLLVTRYDRQTGANAGYERIHQEDFCQALGVVPEMKYQNEGGPDLKACFELLRKATRPSAPNVLRLLDAVVFNALVGNHDAHAKNFSLLYSAGKPVLAPLYDVLSTAVYEALTPKMAMKLGGVYRFSELHARHWARFAEDAGLSIAQTRKRILRMAQTLPIAARQVQATALFENRPIIARIVALIEQRAALTVRRLTDGSSLR
jgi:serine/threonine-protein kinase HipA